MLRAVVRLVLLLGLLQLGTAIKVHPHPQPLEVPPQVEGIPLPWDQYEQGRLSPLELLGRPQIRVSCPQGYVPTASGTCRLENPGCLDPKTGWKNDLANAEQTLARSIEVLQDPRVKSTLVYHFASLYNIITEHEIALAKSGTLEHPGFLLRFIPIFYKLYDDALQNFLSQKGGYHNLWADHFQYSSFQPEDHDFWTYLPYVEASLGKGVRAHISGDMPRALRAAYQSYTKAYCVFSDC